MIAKNGNKCHNDYIGYSVIVYLKQIGRFVMADVTPGESLQYLDSSALETVNSRFLTALRSFTDIKEDIQKNTNTLFDNWVGEARNEYESQYLQLFQKISDIEDALKELYDMTVDAEAAFEDADDQIRQKIAMSQEG